MPFLRHRGMPWLYVGRGKLSVLHDTNAVKLNQVNKLTVYENIQSVHIMHSYPKTFDCLLCVSHVEQFLHQSRGRRRRTRVDLSQSH